MPARHNPLKHKPRRQSRTSARPPQRHPRPTLPSTSMTASMMLRCARPAPDVPTRLGAVRTTRHEAVWGRQREPQTGGCRAARCTPCLRQKADFGRRPCRGDSAISARCFSWSCCSAYSVRAPGGIIRLPRRDDETPAPTRGRRRVPKRDCAESGSIYSASGICMFARGTVR